MWDHVQSACNLKVLLRISGSRDPRDKHKTWTLSQFSSYVCPKVIHDLKSSCLSLANIFRLVQGLLQSPCFPSLNPLTNRWGRQTSNQVSKLKAAFENKHGRILCRWVPESEKGKFVTFSYNGGTVGAIITFPLCGKSHFYFYKFQLSISQNSLKTHFVFSLWSVPQHFHFSKES